jgi:1-acyl-sn-glycerol-3-phosphate acyltransferase
MDTEAFLQLSPEGLRERVPAFVAQPVEDASLSAVISAELAELLASWSDSEVASVLDAIAGVGVERHLHTAHPLLRQAVRIWSGHVLAGSTLNGVEHLSAATAAGPTAVVCNHRSYIDSNAIDTILYGHAPDRLADRFVSAAGPKVYQGLFRRLVSASLNTIPVPQSATLGHTARLPGRDLARQSLEAVAQSHVAMNNGYVLLIYPEGARTRTGRMQPFLPAVHRYFKLPGTRIVPAALTGTARVIGVGERGVRPKPCALRFGPPILVEKAGGPRGALAKAQTAVCDLLPPELRPEEAPAEAGS